MSALGSHTAWTLINLSVPFARTPPRRREGRAWSYLTVHSHGPFTLANISGLLVSGLSPDTALSSHLAVLE